MSSFKVIGLLVLEENSFKCFTIYAHGGHLGHVTYTIYINCLSHFQRRLHMTLALTGKAVLEKNMFENNVYIHVYSPVVGADNTLGSNVSINLIIQSI